MYVHGGPLNVKTFVLSTSIWLVALEELMKEKDQKRWIGLYEKRANSAETCGKLFDFLYFVCLTNVHKYNNILVPILQIILWFDAT